MTVWECERENAPEQKLCLCGNPAPPPPPPPCTLTDAQTRKHASSLYCPTLPAFFFSFFLLLLPAKHAACYMFVKVMFEVKDGVSFRK